MWIESTGVLHLHSRYSDGSGTVPEILDAACAARLDHVVLTDHDSLAAAREGWAGQHGPVTLLTGCEITPRRKGHVLAMRVDHCEGYSVNLGRGTLDKIAAQGGYAIIAHPLGKHRVTLGIRQEAWYDWSHPAVRGLEIWSYTHDWVDEVRWWRMPWAYEFWRHPERHVHGPYPRALAHWDMTGTMRRLAGWGALDCHATPIPLTHWQVFPYSRMFSYLRNHLFVARAQFEADPQAALWQAYADGNGFVAHDILGDSTGARCEALLPDGRTLQMGEEAPFREGTSLTLSLPRAAEVRFIVNGRCRLVQTGDRCELKAAGPGVYRFEVTLDGKPWIYTNPFYLR